MARTAEFGSLWHLAGRFVGALSPAGPAPGDEAWARSFLLPGEQDLWARMSGPDRRHAVGVARDTLRLLHPATPGREVVAAALLHDVGKIDAALGTFARAAVTAVALVAGRGRLAGDGSHTVPRWRARVRAYLTHDRLGADMLAAAGSHPLTVAWAAEHHLPSARWSVEPHLGEALKTADGD